ncbi:cell wall-binding repeat-containing protein [Buchananella felis]|uniref:cell wall-binding repeat-containing protein n=1 Tax=Buchananella felis TaxID=3231492 RepID=UPI0035270CDD
MLATTLLVAGMPIQANADVGTDLDDGVWFNTSDTGGLVTARSSGAGMESRHNIPVRDALNVVADLSGLEPMEPGERVELSLREPFKLQNPDGLLFDVNPLVVAATKAAGDEMPTIEFVGDLVSADGEFGDMVLVFSPQTDGQYQMSGSITSSRADSRIETAADGMVVLAQRDTEQTFAPQREELRLDIDVAEFASRDQSGTVDNVGNHLITLLAVYQSDLAGDVNARLRQYVAVANGAFARSGVSARIVLADKIALPLVDSNDTSDDDQSSVLNRNVLHGDISVDLENLIYKHEDTVSNVDRLRDAIGADVTMAFIGYGLPAGLTYVPRAEGNSRFAAGILFYDDSPAGDRLFVHELGHVFGGGHEAEADSPGAHPFAYGYRIPGVIKSIMAIDCGPNCPTATQFSNPDIPFVGAPAHASGTESANNAKTINLLAPIVSGYRESPVRVSGADRFETAVQASRLAYPEGSLPASVVVANGHNFADVLAAAPLATKLNAPLLFTHSNSVPAVVRDELRRLRNVNLVVIGGTNSVSSGVFAQLKRESGCVSNCVRIAGPDRTSTALAIARHGWNSGTDAVSLVNGNDYPDALSGSVHAARNGKPLVLVPGQLNSAPASVRQYLTSSGVRSVTVVGGTYSVSPGIVNGLASQFSVVRIAGVDRYATSAQVARTLGAGSVFVLSDGHSYSDSLVSASLAGKWNASMLLVRRTCIPASVDSFIYDQSPLKRFLVGGDGSLGAGVQRGTVCG